MTHFHLASFSFVSTPINLIFPFYSPINYSVTLKGFPFHDLKSSLSSASYKWKEKQTYIYIIVVFVTYYCPLKPLVFWPCQSTIFAAVSHSCEIYKKCGSSQTPSTVLDSTAGLGYVTNSWMCGWVTQSSSTRFIFLLYSCHVCALKMLLLELWRPQSLRLKVFQQSSTVDLLY